VTTAKRASLPIRSQEDVVVARRAVRGSAVEIGLSLIDQTKVVTAASELARNMFLYAGGGSVLIEQLEEAGRRGLRLSFEDQGPGIIDIDRALTDGYTTGNGLGLGLGGAKRLSSEFSIRSELGKGTCVVITRWRG
jgi:serine/threonine-protein kinase RsbT